MITATDRPEVGLQDDAAKAEARAAYFNAQAELKSEFPLK